MFVVTEAEATAIRAVFEQQGELSAAVELRRLFPCHHRQRAGAGVAVNRIERQSDTQAAERGLLPRPPARPDPEGGPDALKAAKHATTSGALELGASTGGGEGRHRPGFLSGAGTRTFSSASCRSTSLRTAAALVGRSSCSRRHASTSRKNSSDALICNVRFCIMRCDVMDVLTGVKHQAHPAAVPPMRSGPTEQDHAFRWASDRGS
jgi:hypothetical protein